MISAIIFDSDGVLVNGGRFSTIIAREYPVDPVKVTEFFTGKFQECLVGKADLKESVTPYLSSFGWTGTADELLDYWFKSEHSLDQAIIDYIQRLRRSGMPIVLATNQEKYRTEYMLEHMGFKDTFDTIYSSAHLGLKKPAVEFFAKVVDDIGVPKEQVLFWDDDQENIDGALEYGIHAEFYTDYDSFHETMATKYGL